MRVRRHEEKSAHSVIGVHDWVDIVCRTEKTESRQQQPPLDGRRVGNDV